MPLERQIFVQPEEPCGTEEQAVVKHRLGRPRTFGRLLGLAKKAVEACVDEGDVEALASALAAFVPGYSQPAETHRLASNPAVRKEKGRPTGAVARPKASHADSCARLACPFGNKRSRLEGANDHDGDVDMTQAYNAAEITDPSATAVSRQCKHCGKRTQPQHDKRTCPWKHLTIAQAKQQAPQASLCAIGVGADLPTGGE